MSSATQHRIIKENLLNDLRAASIRENSGAAAKVAAAAAIHVACADEPAALLRRDDYRSYGTSEIALILGCSATVADGFIGLGHSMLESLPKLAKAFTAGELDLVRVRTVYNITENLSAETTAQVEDEVVDAARRLSPGPLETEIWGILDRAAPEEAAALRKLAKKYRNVKYTPKGDLGTIKADLTPGNAAASWQVIEEVASTVCGHDPRSLGERRSDAFAAIMHFERRLQCECDLGDECEKKDCPIPGRRVPLAMIVIDVATLLGLLENPAYLAGHGPIDAEFAREMAGNAQWQILIAEAITLAESMGLIEEVDPDDGSTPDDSPNDDGPNDDDGPSDKPGPGTPTYRRTSRSEAPTPDAAEPGVPAPDAPEPDVPESDTAGTDTGGRTRSAQSAAAAAASQFSTRTPMGRGARHQAGCPLPHTEKKQSESSTGPYFGNALLASALEDAIAENPTLGEPLYPDGHGGAGSGPGDPGPSKTDLRYKPNAELTARVRLRDHHCRFPGCRRAARQSQLDHVINYKHGMPRVGGWTIATNLHCLCLMHHRLKTAGLWNMSMLAGGVVLWKSNAGTTVVTLPAAGYSHAVIDNPLKPKVSRPRPGQKCSGHVAYPDDPLPEPSDAAEPEVATEPTEPETTEPEPPAPPVVDAKTEPDEPPPF